MGIWVKLIGNLAVLIFVVALVIFSLYSPFCEKAHGLPFIRVWALRAGSCLGFSAVSSYLHLPCWLHLSGVTPSPPPFLRLWMVFWLTQREPPQSIGELTRLLCLWQDTHETEGRRISTSTSTDSWRQWAFLTWGWQWQGHRRADRISELKIFMH